VAGVDPAKTLPQRRGVAFALALIAGLYITQGISHGFFNRTFPVLLRQDGVAIEIVGLSHLVFLPWVLSVLWSPLVDRWHLPGVGRRKSWIVPTQVLLAATLMLVAVWLSARTASLSGSWLILALLALSASTLAATQDVATDGYAVEMLPESARGWGNGWQIGGYWIGMLFGSGVLLLIQAWLGLVSATAIIAVFILLVCLAVALRPEPSYRPGSVHAAPSLLKVFRRPDLRLMLIVIVLYRFGDAFGKAMITPYLVDIGLSMTDIGWLLGTSGVGFALAGCVVGGVLMHPLGRHRALIAFGVMQVFAIAAIVLIVTLRATSFPILVAVVGLEYFAVSLAFIAMYSIMMDVCSPDQPGTDFTAQACVGNLVGIAASAVSGFSVAALGYQGHFVLALSLTVAGLIGVVCLLPRLSERGRTFATTIGTSSGVP
jgi:MFS family permease